jgi:eukaryotic-like serine/threonine-protein kinase
MMAMGRLAGRYELLDRIGTGGYGEVWRGMDSVLARPVAIKLLQDEHAVQPEAMMRFRAEARHAGALSHPCIAHVYDYCEPSPPDPPFLVMELVDGLSLAELLSRGPLEVARAMDVIGQAAAGLHAAHQAGLVHRDIKPGNLLISRSGPVKITDFGIAQAQAPDVSGPVTMTGMVLGTAGYMAPERIEGNLATVASDLYALGVVAHECLAGLLPRSALAVQTGDATAERVFIAPRSKPLPPLPADVPPDVAALVRRLTARDPAGRPASAGEVARQAAALRDKYRDAPPRADVAALEDTAAREDDGDLDPASGNPISGRPQPTVRANADAPERSPVVAAGVAPITGPDPRTGERTEGQPGHRGAGRPRRRNMLIIATGGLVGLALLVFGVVEAIQKSGVTGSPASPTSPAAGPSIRLREGDLVGQPAADVIEQLKHDGLLVSVVWQTSSEPLGQVLRVAPVGVVRRDTAVTVYAAEPGPAAISPTPATAQQLPPFSDSTRTSPTPSVRPVRSKSPSPSTSPSSGSGSPSASTSSSPSPSTSPSGPGTPSPGST